MYSPLYGNEEDITSAYVLSRDDISEMIHPLSSVDGLLLNALILDVPSKFIDDDGIDQIKHDTFAPWLEESCTDVDVL